MGPERRRLQQRVIRGQTAMEQTGGLVGGHIIRGGVRNGRKTKRQAVKEKLEAGSEAVRQAERQAREDIACACVCVCMCVQWNFCGMNDVNGELNLKRREGQ